MTRSAGSPPHTVARPRSSNKFSHEPPWGLANSATRRRPASQPDVCKVLHRLGSLIHQRLRVRRPAPPRPSWVHREVAPDRMSCTTTSAADIERRDPGLHRAESCRTRAGCPGRAPGCRSCAEQDRQEQRVAAVFPRPGTESNQRSEFSIVSCRLVAHRGWNRCTVMSPVALCTENDACPVRRTAYRAMQPSRPHEGQANSAIRADRRSISRNWSSRRSHPATQSNERTQ